MNMWTAHLKRWRESALQLGAGLARALTAPSGQLSPEERPRVQLLATYLLLMGLITFVGAMVLRNIGSRAEQVLLATAIAFVSGYIISRTKYYRAALVIAILIPAVPPLAFCIFKPPEINLSAELMWLSIPLIIATLLLKVWQAVLVALCYIAFIIGLAASHLIGVDTVVPVMGYLFIITFFATVISVIRQRAQKRLEEQLSELQRAERLQADENAVLTLIGQGAALDEILEAIVRLGEAHNPSVRGSILLCDATKERLLHTCAPSLPEDYIALLKPGVPIAPNSGSCGTAAYLRKRVIIQDMENSPFFPPEVIKTAAKDGLRACWSQPIISSSGELLGTIANYSQHKGEPDAADLRVLEWSARMAALAIERKQAEKALKESEEKFAKAFQASPVSMAIVRIKDSTLVDINQKFVEIDGFSPEEAIGHTPTELGIWVNEEERDRILRLMQEKGGVRNEEVHLRAKSGKERLALLSAEVVNIGGEPYSIAMTVDITARKEAEMKLKETLEDLKRSTAQLAATNKELEAFSYSVSHDLRAPLRSIDGFSQALLEDYHDRLDATAQDYLRRLRRASQKMGELIDAILRLSRLTRTEMRREPVDLSALAWEIISRLKETEPERKVEVHIAQGLTANADPQLIRIALENLLGNAWKFTAKNADATIEFGAMQRDGKTIYFVRDNGAGFDMTYADKLFGTFQRLHDSRQFPGTGIGLATVQRIIHRHGGTVWAEGKVGKGATFYFTLD